MSRNPPWDVRLAVAFCLASFASFFAMGAAIGLHLYDRFRAS